VTGARLLERPSKNRFVETSLGYWRRACEIAAKNAIQGATVGGGALALLDVFGGPHPGAFLLAGCTLLGPVLIATAIKGRPH
jgi:hypothetical protein